MARASDNPNARSAPCHTVLVSNQEEVCRFQDHIEALLKAYQYSDGDIFSIKLSVHEALTNAVKHGNRLDPSRKVSVVYRILPHYFEIVITDEGQGFDPRQVPDCRAPENLERPCGRGLLLMQHYMTEVTFNECGNSVSMRKVRSD